MSVITNIEIQRKNKNRVNIYIDGKFFISVNCELIYKLNLKNGDTIDEAKIKSIFENEMYKKAQNKALNILTYSDKSENSMRDQLAKEFDQHTINSVINYLKKYNLIDDKVLVKKLVDKNINCNKWGKNKIKLNLYNKGFNKNDINEVVSNIKNDKEFENALSLAQKKLKQIKETDKRKIYEKLYRHLAYKGFDLDTTKKVINKILDYDEYDLC